MEKSGLNPIQEDAPVKRKKKKKKRKRKKQLIY